MLFALLLSIGGVIACLAFLYGSFEVGRSVASTRASVARLRERGKLFAAAWDRGLMTMTDASARGIDQVYSALLCLNALAGVGPQIPEYCKHGPQSASDHSTESNVWWIDVKDGGEAWMKGIDAAEEPYLRFEKAQEYSLSRPASSQFGVGAGRILSGVQELTLALDHPFDGKVVSIESVIFRSLTGWGTNITVGARRLSLVALWLEADDLLGLPTAESLVLRFDADGDFALDSYEWKKAAAAQPELCTLLAKNFAAQIEEAATCSAETLGITISSRPLVGECISYFLQWSGSQNAQNWTSAASSPAFRRAVWRALGGELGVLNAAVLEGHKSERLTARVEASAQHFAVTVPLYLEALREAGPPQELWNPWEVPKPRRISISQDEQNWSDEDEAKHPGTLASLQASEGKESNDGLRSVPSVETLAQKKLLLQHAERLMELAYAPLAVAIAATESSLDPGLIEEWNASEMWWALCGGLGLTAIVVYIGAFSYAWMHWNAPEETCCGKCSFGIILFLVEAVALAAFVGTLLLAATLPTGAQSLCTTGDMSHLLKDNVACTAALRVTNSLPGCHGRIDCENSFLNTENSCLQDGLLACAEMPGIDSKTVRLMYGGLLACALIAWQLSIAFCGARNAVKSQDDSPQTRNLVLERERTDAEAEENGEENGNYRHAQRMFPGDGVGDPRAFLDAGELLVPGAQRGPQYTRVPMQLCGPGMQQFCMPMPGQPGAMPMHPMNGMPY